MNDTLLVSTRKGLFTVSREAGKWEIAAVDFLGDNVTLTLTDPRDGRRYAALDHGHFGVKLHRSTLKGWEEIACPTYPPMPEGYEELDFWGRPLKWSTARIWALAAGGPDVRMTRYTPRVLPAQSKDLTKNLAYPPSGPLTVFQRSIH